VQYIYIYIYIYKIVVRISKSNANKNKLFYKYDDKSCDYTFISWCKPINDNELIVGVREGANYINKILDKMKKIKDELCRV
jgi:hypothetical protein